MTRRLLIGAGLGAPGKKPSKKKRKRQADTLRRARKLAATRANPTGRAKNMDIGLLSHAARTTR